MTPSSSKLGRMKAAMAAAAVTTLSASVASAATIGINFIGDAYYAAGANVTATAYGVAVPNWTNATKSETGATFLAGTPSLTVTFTAVNDWAQGGSPIAGNGEVNFGYLDDTGAGATVTITGLSAWLANAGAPAYTVQVIQSSDNATGFANVDVFNSNGGTNLVTLINTTTGPGGELGGASGVSGSLTSDTLFFDPQARVGTTRGTIAGIIITTVPEPSIALLGGIGMLGLLRRRRA